MKFAQEVDAHFVWLQGMVTELANGKFVFQSKTTPQTLSDRRVQNRREEGTRYNYIKE